MNDREFAMPDGRSAEEYLRDYRLTLEQIASGTPPTEDELSQAPLISNWIIDEVCYTSGERYRHIFGNFHDHPFISVGGYGRTSPLLQLDRDMTWARCRSRVYRLSDPLSRASVLERA
ncbi:DUF6634 family protein [Pararhizobium qamdonense]|uniref:DUF6634 family protein n=1 Tax=Pararhizobium qamdonense TaxID=3031126 RepID=UPI0023E1871C|nr:DUF6634 family protein [Pararhizobium qamdonense]